jgi:hypothetical protein
MSTARIVVFVTALGAGGVAAQLPTVEVLVARSEIGPGQTVKPVRYGISSTSSQK